MDEGLATALKIGGCIALAVLLSELFGCGAGLEGAGQRIRSVLRRRREAKRASRTTGPQAGERDDDGR